MKVACDLIVLILTGDESMNHLYAEGKGEVFQEMVNWLVSDDEDLQITGVLAMGNFARTDKHCIQMVQQDVCKKLLNLVKKNNTSAGDIRLQHALLSALRNLAIPTQNKSSLLADGLVDTVLPMASIPTFPVVFKLLGTLRMVIDGQESAASDLGKKSELIHRLVEWCQTEDHPGVQGESNRLLAWLIKNSRNSGVMQTVMDAGGVPWIVSMVAAEHTVMQNEALVALTLLAATMRDKTSETLVSADIGSKLNKLMEKSNSLEPEVILNALTLVEQLSKCETTKCHILESGLKSKLQSLSSCTDKRIQEEVQRLTVLLDSG